MNTDELLDRAGNLKEALVAYASSPGFARRLSQAMSDFSGLGGGEQNQWAEAVESLLYDPDQGGREPLLDRYLRTNKNIEPDERLVYEGWRERNVIGVFRVDARKGARLSLHNLIDQMDYDSYATAGAEAISFVQRGGYVMTRLVPIGDLWTISGTMRLFGPRDLPGVQTLAASLLKRFPTLVFNNPANVEQGRRIVGEHHTTFLDLFGAHIVSGTGGDIIAAYRSFLNACSEASVAANPKASALVTAAEQIAPDDSFPPELAESDDVALYHHPLMGVSFLVCYGQVEAACRTPPANAEDPAAEVLRGYVEDKTVPGYVLEDLAAKYPDTVDAAYRAALSSPGFRWEHDGVALLRLHKPNFTRDKELPGVTPVPSSLIDEYRRLS
ncbi:hypothetical protein QK290_04005 [Pseudarthrobacter sp. AL07]|uniref:hypothetical protein n=1 Tax=unclassified Pseudarthrobacter TaxID=2647000 RepID=UPI00249BC9A8|nr:MULTISPECIES: hypothetical protein [unclassified Pseudarthrobacter]MDI3193789.1 hypothetical protein [Pseudarthrobacter sp. AL20]MDI3207701.1 hypothetical protein [Pseudarthrobacter sp. AL07]